MRKIIVLIFVALCARMSVAQNFSNQLFSNDIFLSAYIPQPVEGLPEIAVQNLQNKLTRIITQNGMAELHNQRFILTARVDLLSKDIMATAPAMYAYILEVTFYIADGFDGKIFSSSAITAKGVGETETKAYLSAIRNIKENSPQLLSFINEGRKQIVNYYESHCDLILKEAEMLAQVNNYEGAIASIVSIPYSNSACYEKYMTEVVNIYQKMINRDCMRKLNEAYGIWSSGQDYYSASSAASVLVEIEPDAECFDEVRSLYDEISSRVQAMDDREWNFKLKEQQQESERIEAIRAIGVAYGSNQQPTTIHYKTLW